MSSRQTTLSPLLRTFAVLALGLFVSAQALCFVHCNFGGGHGDKAQPSCHGLPQKAASHDAPGGPTPPTPAAAATCATLKTMLTSGDAPTLLPPTLHTLYLLAPVTLSLDATEKQLEPSLSRQARPHDWIFTPEVSLGPACRTHAPPILA